MRATAQQIGDIKSLMGGHDTNTTDEAARTMIDILRQRGYDIDEICKCADAVSDLDWEYMRRLAESNAEVE